MTVLHRREFLRAGTLSLVGLAVACGKDGGSTTTTASGSIDALIAGRPQAFQMIAANAETLSRREERFAFALLRPGEGTPLSGGAGRVWVARNRTDEALGPFPAAYHGEGLGEKGIYVARITFPSEGQWFALAEAQPSGVAQPGIGVATATVGPVLPMPRPGERAVTVPTPTVDDHRGVDPICTRKPPCSMHGISVHRAVRTGKPTVVIIATPAFCSSRLCGPEVDIVQAVSRESAFAGKVNFVHIEVYRDDDPDTVAKQILSPAAEAWKLASEPAIYFIDADGTVAERYIGPVDEGDVRDATRALLA